MLQKRIPRSLRKYMRTSGDFLLDTKVYKPDLTIINKNLTTIGNENYLF